jgi:hypothetical protein
MIIAGAYRALWIWKEFRSRIVYTGRSLSGFWRTIFLAVCRVVPTGSAESRLVPISASESSSRSPAAGEIIPPRISSPAYRNVERMKLVFNRPFARSHIGLSYLDHLMAARACRGALDSRRGMAQISCRDYRAQLESNTSRWKRLRAHDQPLLRTLFVDALPL